MSKNKKIKKNINNNIDEKEHKKMFENPITIITSVLAIVISIISLIFTIYFSTKEYEYKLDPELEIKGGFGIQKTYTDNPIEIGLKNLHIEILEKNNLKSAYLINSDNTVEKLEINDIENTIESKLKNDKIDFSSSGFSYQYKFLLFSGLDDGSELHLIYVKSKGEQFTFNGVTNIEVWGLMNGYNNNPDYEGERQMAEQYFAILDGIKKSSIE